MKQKVSQKAGVVDLIYAHLVTAFRNVGGNWDKNIPCPPLEASFEVVEPIETCHPCCGLGLEKINGYNCLPVGRYKVITWEDDRGSHKLYLEDLQSGDPVWCFYGVDDRGLVMDWRGMKPVVQ
ncbi:MAG: hypothetical protein WC750_04250 [Patescibacteria group bacterium]|jgi:hypothetical protein